MRSLLLAIIALLPVPALAAGSIHLTSPNGGEVWEEGKTYTVTWEASKDVSEVMFFLSVNGGDYQKISDSGPASAGSVQWTIPHGMLSEAGEDVGVGTLRMKIQSVGISSDPDLMDVSDANFSIVPPSHYDPYGPYPDVPPDHRNVDAISYMRFRGIMMGYSDGTFRPDQLVNRAEFLKIVIAANYSSGQLGTCNPATVYHFSDVPDSNAWYVPYLCQAVLIHIIGGYPDGTIRPSSIINFAEASKMMMGAFNHYGLDDITDDESWFAPFVRLLDMDNAIPLSITSFDHQITRGEMAEMMYRILSKTYEKRSRTYEELRLLSI